MTKIALVYFNAGGGHRAAARALEAVIAEQRRPWAVELVNLFEVLDPDAQFVRFTGMAPETYYNKRLAKGWTIGLAQELKLLQAMIGFGHARISAALQKHWLQSEPDLVVSLIPNFNRALCESLAEVLPGVPFVTVLTDLADFPPAFWMEATPLQHLVCGTERAYAQALALGRAPDHVHRTSGMIIHPDFYRPLDDDRRASRIAWGMDPDRPVGLVLFGGHGSSAMATIDSLLPDVQLILLCGHNAALATRLRKAAPRAVAKRIVVGFTSDVRRYMRASDFFIGKPGPGSMSEALHEQLPVITLRNTWTMPQERYNTEWIVEQSAGLVCPAWKAVRPSVLAMLRQLDTFRGRVAALRNDAVFEVPEILAAILERERTASTPALRAALRPSDAARRDR